jgi:hypothetical protein
MARLVLQKLLDGGVMARLVLQHELHCLFEVHVRHYSAARPRRAGPATNGA